MTYDDLEPELQVLVPDAGVYAGWSSALEIGVVPWIRSEHNRSLWDVVLIVSRIRGYVVPNLKRERFARLVIASCPSMQGEDPARLRASMEKASPNYSSRDEENYDSLPEWKWLKHWGSMVDSLLKGCRVENPKEHLASRLIELLRERCTPAANGPLVEFCTGKYYKGYNGSVHPAVSIEFYLSEELRKRREYSMVVAYECLPGRLEFNAVAGLLYMYSNVPTCKLMLVTDVGATQEVISHCTLHRIGLMRLPSAGGMDYVLPRSVGDARSGQRAYDILCGRQQSPYAVVLDGSSTSLEGHFRELGIRVNDTYLGRRLPRLGPSELRRRADDVRLRLRRDGFKVLGLESLAEEEGLALRWEDLPDGQVGALDIATKEITLSRELQGNDARCRFTLAHELGHYFLHYEALRDYVTSFGDNADRLTSFATSSPLTILEWQANLFASFLLLPEDEVRRRFLLRMPEREARMGYLFYDRQPVNRALFASVAGPVALEFGVSRQALRICLQMMKLVVVDESRGPQRLRIPSSFDW